MPSHVAALLRFLVVILGAGWLPVGALAQGVPDVVIVCALPESWNEDDFYPPYRVESWTAGEVSAFESATGKPVVRVHPATGTCTDPAGLPLQCDGCPDLQPGSVAASWPPFVCTQSFEADASWNGPDWYLSSYGHINMAPPDPKTGGCREPYSPSYAPASERAAAFAVYYSMLELAGNADLLYDWMHPDAKSVVPSETVVGWYETEFLPSGPFPIEVEKVEFVDWTWPVTGVTYGSAAEVTYRQRFADGTETRDAIRLVRDGEAWRWFFGRDGVWVEEQIARFGGEAMAPDLAGLLPPTADPPGLLPLLEEGVGEASEIAATFPDATETAALLDGWGWTESVYRTFAGSGMGRGNPTRLEVSIHRFASDAAATEAAEYFAEGRAEILGLWVAREAQSPTGDIAVLGATGAGDEASLYAVLGPLVVRVTAVVPDGDSVAVAETFMDGIRGRFIRHSSPPGGDELAPEPDILPVCVYPANAGPLSPWSFILTKEHIEAGNPRFASIDRVHPETGDCYDPSNLPLGYLGGDRSGALDAQNVGDRFPRFSCYHEGDGRWNGPVWVLHTGHGPGPRFEAPLEPSTGLCPAPRENRPDGDPRSRAAMLAVYFSMLETRTDADRLYDWMHPDARALVPREAVTRWYAANVFPKGPQPIRVERVDLEDWTWPVTGTTYGSAAKVTYSQLFADGTEIRDSMHLVRDGDAWRWFFGGDAEWIDARIREYAPGWEAQSTTELLVSATGDEPNIGLSQSIRTVAGTFSNRVVANNTLVALGLTESSAISDVAVGVDRVPVFVELAVHRFTTSAGASQAIDAFASDRAGLWLHSVEPHYLGYAERALVGDSLDGHRVVLLAQRGPYLVEIDATGIDAPRTEFEARTRMGLILANEALP